MSVIEIREPRSAVLEVHAPVGVLHELRGTPGPTGDTGVQGPPGPSGAAHQHTQAVAGAVWTIEHNLGYDPAGVVVISGGYVLDGFGVAYLVTGVSVRLSFDISVAGVAYLS